MPLPATPTAGIAKSVNGVGILYAQAFDLNVIGNFTEPLMVGNANKAAIQISIDTGAISAPFVVTLQGSIDGIKWFDTGKTISVEGVSTVETIDQYLQVRAIVSTANGAALTALLSIVTKTIY